MSGYRLADDPAPGALARAAVNPIFPMLAMMFAGAWLSLPWFALNAVALGSPTQKRELRLCAYAVVGALLLGFMVLWAWPPETLGERGFLFGLLALSVFKLGLAYWILTLQSRTFAVYEYYGGVVQNGLPVLVLATALLRSTVLFLVDHELWLIVVS